MFWFPKSGSIGYKIAYECLEYGLRLGALVKLSKIVGYIQLMPLSKAVEYGFYKRMNEIVKSGEITCYSFQGGEEIFVHRDYKAIFQKRLKDAKDNIRKE